jgi:uncharacterized protein
MGRILFWLLVALAAYIGYRWWRIKQQAAAVRGAAGPAKVESMVRCDVCGLNLPQSEAIGAANRWYCSEEHRRRAARDRSEA